MCGGGWALANNFNVLDNKAIGRNIALYRKIRGLKAVDVAQKLGIGESSYSRYERGDGALTVDLIQQIAQILNVDPLNLIAVHPSNFIENGNNSPIAINGNSHYITTNEQQTQLLTELVKNVISLNEKFMAFLDERKS